MERLVVDFCGRVGESAAVHPLRFQPIDGRCVGNHEVVEERLFVQLIISVSWRRVEVEYLARDDIRVVQLLHRTEEGDAVRVDEDTLVGVLAVQPFKLVEASVDELLLEVRRERLTLLCVNEVAEAVDESPRQADVVIAQQTL